MELRFVTVADGRLLSLATVGPDDTATYGGDSPDIAQGAVRRYRLRNPDASEADAVRALARDGWSNGYVMVQLD